MAYVHNAVTGPSIQAGWDFQQALADCSHQLSPAQQQSELVSLARHLQRHHPAYRQIYGQAALASPHDIPIIDKATVGEHGRAFLAHSGVTEAALAAYLDKFDIGATLGDHLAFQTSGSSGRKSYTLYGLFAFGRSLYALYARAVAGSGARSLSYIGLTDRYNGGNQWMYHMGAHISVQLLHYFDDTAGVLARLLAFEPEVIFTKPGKLLEIGRLLKARGARLGKLKHLISVGENISPEDAAEIHHLFGIHAHNSFSTTETGPIAYQADPLKPELELYENLNHVEIVDAAGAPIARAGEMGRLVVSSGYNLSFPLIRYDLADCVHWIEGKVGKSMSFVQGRNKEKLRFTRGAAVDIVDEMVFWRFAHPAVRASQFIQHGEHRLRARLALVATPGAEPASPQVLAAALSLHLRRHGVVVALDLTIEPVDAIGPDVLTSKVKKTIVDRTNWQ